MVSKEFKEAVNGLVKDVSQYIHAVGQNIEQPTAREFAIIDQVDYIQELIYETEQKLILQVYNEMAY